MRMPIALAALLLLSGADEWAEFNALARDKDPAKRCEAVAKIAGRHDLLMVKALMPLLADAHPRVRKRAGEALNGALEADCVDYLRRVALKHASGAVRARSAACLSRKAPIDSAAALIAALDDRDPEVRAAAAAALVPSKSADAFERLARVAEEDSSGPVRASALEALASLDPARAAPIAEKAMKGRSFEARIAAVHVASRFGAEIARKIFAAGLSDGDWRVKVQALESAAAAREGSVAGEMIDLLGREKGRLRWDACHALCALTDKDFGLDAKAWKRWWDVNRDSFAAPPKGRSPGQVKAGETGATGAHFFSVPILSERIVIILDITGSMREPAPDAAGTKLDVAKRETNRAVGQLSETTWFNIIVVGCAKDGSFQKEQKLWKKSLQAATARARTGAQNFVDRQTAGGQTNLWDMVEIAFEDDAIDSIFLYTDGGVNRGNFTGTSDIFDELRRMNRFRKLMIHTVEVAADKPNTEDNLRLLTGLAERTKGLYRLAK